MSHVAVQMRPAIFLDRDGTIIEDCGDLGDPTQIELLPGIVDALRELHKHFALFIVTNQSAVARGTLTMDRVNAVNARLVAMLSDAGVTIEQVYVCPHARADGCNCIKPKPHFLRLAAAEHSIDLRRSFTVGDHPHDVEFALSVGATGVYVLSGHGAKHRGDLRIDCPVFDTLAGASALFLASVVDTTT
jgi:D-glycero-D-manno-heptose 1,7-bisphosphate phosphatase